MRSIRNIPPPTPIYSPVRGTHDFAVLRVSGLLKERNLRCQEVIDVPGQGIGASVVRFALCTKTGGGLQGASLTLIEIVEKGLTV